MPELFPLGRLGLLHTLDVTNNKLAELPRDIVDIAEVRSGGAGALATLRIGANPLVAPPLNACGSNGTTGGVNVKLARMWMLEHRPVGGVALGVAGGGAPALQSAGAAAGGGDDAQLGPVLLNGDGEPMLDGDGEPMRGPPPLLDGDGEVVLGPALPPAPLGGGGGGATLPPLPSGGLSFVGAEGDDIEPA